MNKLFNDATTPTGPSIFDRQVTPSDSPASDASEEDFACDVNKLCEHGEDPARCPFCHAP